MAPETKIILITGANSGVGLASAKMIVAASPHYHVIIASRNADNGSNAVKEVQALGDTIGTLSSVQLDVTDDVSVKRAALEIEKGFGRIDVLVNNAGIATANGDTRTKLSQVMTVNLIGPAVVSEAFMPLLCKSKEPMSIYVSSGLGSLARAADPSNPSYEVDFTPYRVSKSALNMWMLKESLTASQKGVKVFGFCPGLVRSNLRGKSEEAISAGGVAGDPRESGETLLSIIEGNRNADVGRVVTKEGVHPW